MCQAADRSRESGFTLVEVIAAAMVLLVGMLGTLTLVEGAARATSSAGALEAATSLGREVLEKSKQVAYADLTTAAVQTKLKADPDLVSTQPAKWTISRRGVEYTVSVSVCAIDDAADGFGSRDGGSFCAGLPAAGTADRQAEDAKRVTVALTWGSGRRIRHATRSALRTSRTGADAPRITSMSVSSPTVPSPTAPVITNSGTSAATLAMAATSTTARVVISVGGVDVGNASSAGNARDWTYSLAISGMQDGTYEVGARAIDALGIASEVVTIPLVLDRFPPPAPAGLMSGRNEVIKNAVRSSVVELDWLPTDQPKVIGYRTYRPDGTLACPGSMTATVLTSSCMDFTPQTGTYQVAAIYRNAAGTLLEGARANAAIAAATGRTFYLGTTTANATGCGTAQAVRDMAEGTTGTDPETAAPLTKTDDTWRFCSPALGAGSIMAGNAGVVAYMDNLNTKDACPVTFGLFLNGTQVGSNATVNVPVLTTTVQTYTVSIPVPATTISAGAQLNVLYSQLSGSPCDQSHIRVGGTVNRSRLVLPGMVITLPSAPTGLTATRGTDGSVALTWSASPTSGIAFYRIYRDGQEHTQRYDATSEATTTYTDPNRDGGTHTYRVTAVTSSLTESLHTAGVTA